MEFYTGVRQIPVRQEVIDSIYKDKYLDIDRDFRIFDRRLKFPNQNEYLLFQSIEANTAAIARVKDSKIILINSKDVCISNVKPRNVRQHMTMDALLDDSIKVLVITGRAGTGKTLMVLAAALHKMEDCTYRRLILTKPMSQVGKHPLGILPGEIDDKFEPYLDNYIDNIEHLLSGRYRSARDLIDQYRMDFKPLQLIRGAKWQGAFVIADEVQVLNFHEMLSLGTRVAEGSKIVIMGDLGQRDDNIDKEKTGMFKFVNDPQTRECPFAASIELEKIEQGEVATLFTDVFDK